MNGNFFTSKEKKLLEKNFDEKQNSSGDLSFQEFKDIIVQLGFEKTVVSDVLEKLRKKSKETYNIGNDLEIFLSIFVKLFR